MAKSKACVALARAVRPRQMNQATLAAKLGVSQQAVSAWLTGRAKPIAEHMLAIEKLLGIPMRSWCEEAPR